MSPTGLFTCLEVLADLTDAYEAAGRAPATIEVFRAQVTPFVAFLKAHGRSDAIEAIAPRDIEAYLAAQRRRGLKPATSSIAYRTLRRFFAFALEREYIARNPLAVVPAPRVPVEPVRFASDEELGVLLRYIERSPTFTAVRDAACLRLLADTGLRRGELDGLRLDDLDLEHRTAHIRATTSKTRRGRVVAYGPKTANAIRVYLRTRAKYLARHGVATEALWVSQRGELTGNGMLFNLRRRCREAGVAPVTLHSFRHRWAALNVQAGMPMPYLMNLGGWSSAQMVTARYGQHDISARAVKYQATALRKQKDP